MKNNSKLNKPISTVITNENDTSQPQPEAQSVSYSEKIYQFSKDPEQLREFYNHLQWLNQETIELLREKKLPKKFFEEISKPKKRLLLDLIAQKFSDDEITGIVSVAVQLFVEEYENTGKVYNWKNLSKFLIEDQEPVKPIPKMKANIFKYEPAPLFEIMKITIGGTEKIQKKIVKSVSKKKKKNAKLKR
jgi:hypothetical protein